MVDHIQIWVQVLEFTTFKMLFPSQFADEPLCVRPDADLFFNEIGKHRSIKRYRPAKLVYFWRTDRELTNCLKCLATLREMESD